MKTYVIKKSAAPGELTVDYADELNEEQLKVVLKGDGPCLVLAGAGSGKTRTITYRVSYLIERGLPPEHVLLLTFTNKAAREMLGRVSALVGDGAARIWGGTFHSVCHRILRECATRAGLRNGFTILDAEDARDLMKVCVRDVGVDPKAKRFPSPAVLLEISSFANNGSLPVEEALEARHPHFMELLPQIRDIVSRYAERKRDSNSVDFDDLLLLTCRLLRSDDAVRERYARQFRSILVDEYQDTNHLQAEIVRLLASVHGNVLVVGDDAQSIYSFRGADIRNILEFPKKFPGTTVFRLETNYRSTPDILDLANDVIAKNTRQFPKELKAVKARLVKPSLVTAASASQEAEFVAQRALELRDEGVPLKEIAVLFRATHHSQALEFELMKRGIPYDYRGGLKFFDRAHVKDVLAHLRILINKDDAVAWMRALSLQVGIGSVTAEKIYQRVRTIGSLEEVDGRVSEGLTAKAATGWNGFLETLDALRDAENRPSAAIRAMLDSDYVAYLENEYPDWRERVEDLGALADFAETYESLETFLVDAALRDELSSGKRGKVGSPESPEDKIVLSTIHQAKGLEWEAVFVIHMAEGQFPNKKAVLSEEGVEEERRLFYVAVTRARRELHLCHPLIVGFGDFFGEAKSQFLDEADPSLLEPVRLSESYDDLPTLDVDAIAVDPDSPKRRRGLLKDISEY